jgi:hypothetical protein
MNKTFPVVDAITDAVAALPFHAKLHALSVSLKAGGAIVTVQRDHDNCVTYEWAAVNPSHLFWGHYDMTEEQANDDHSKRFARLTGADLGDL